MKTEKAIMYLCLVALSVIGSSCSKQELLQPDTVNCGADYTSHPDNSEYQDALDQYVATSVAPGSVIGVKKYQQAEWIGSSGLSNLEYKTGFEVCTQFRSGSVTKMFTAVVVMQLYEEEELSLESTVAEILPEIKDDIPDSERMTVTQLLNHSSGLNHPTDDDINYRLTLINRPDYIGSLEYKERLEEYIYGKALKHSPGTESYYSNAGYWVLQMIIEKITGKTLQQNLEERIFIPLSLDNTYLEKRDDRNVSRGYNYSGNKMKDVTIWDSADSDGDPAAGIISNARDLLIFGEALFKGGLVSQASLDLMMTTTSFPSCGGDCGYGLGIETWDTGTNSGYGKNGSSMGVDANLIFFPEQNTTIVIFSNYGGGNRKDVIDVLLDI